MESYETSQGSSSLNYNEGNYDEAIEKFRRRLMVNPQEIVTKSVIDEKFVTSKLTDVKDMK